MPRAQSRFETLCAPRRESNAYLASRSSRLHVDALTRHRESQRRDFDIRPDFRGITNQAKLTRRVERRDPSSKSFAESIIDVDDRRPGSELEEKAGLRCCVSLIVP